MRETILGVLVLVIDAALWLGGEKLASIAFLSLVGAIVAFDEFLKGNEIIENFKYFMLSFTFGIGAFLLWILEIDVSTR